MLRFAAAAGRVTMGSTLFRGTETLGSPSFAAASELFESCGAIDFSSEGLRFIWLGLPLAAIDGLRVRLITLVIDPDEPFESFFMVRFLAAFSLAALSSSLNTLGS